MSKKIKMGLTLGLARRGDQTNPATEILEDLEDIEEINEINGRRQPLDMTVSPNNSDSDTDVEADSDDEDDDDDEDQRSDGELTTESGTDEETDDDNMPPLDDEDSEGHEPIPLPGRVPLVERFETYLGGRVGGDEPTNRVQVVTLAMVFVLSVMAVIGVYVGLPNFEESEKQFIKFPVNIEEAKILGDILYRYKDKYFYQVLSGVCVSYIFLQTFAIPGSIFLSIMSGFLFTFPVALFLICFCSATGASFCYLLSFLIGKRIVYRFFPERAQEWSETVQRHRNNLLNYIIFLRITPLIPNWFINITAPVLGVPLFPFWLGTFVGVGPPSIIAIQAGTTLHELASANDAVSWQSILILLLVGVVSLVPIILKDAMKSYFA